MNLVNPVEENTETWDKKKIFIALCGLIFVVFLIYTANNYFSFNLQFKDIENSSKSGKVAGDKTYNIESKISDYPKPNINFSTEKIQEGAQERLNTIKKQVEQLSISDIASSSPQVQKVIKDLESLQNYPKDQAKQMCENICKNL